MKVKPIPPVRNSSLKPLSSYAGFSKVKKCETNINQCGKNVLTTCHTRVGNLQSFKNAPPVLTSKYLRPTDETIEILESHNSEASKRKRNSKVKQWLQNNFPINCYNKKKIFKGWCFLF